MYKFISTAVNSLKVKLTAIWCNYLTIYVIMIILKLIYFNYQTGLHKIGGLQLLTTLGSIFVLISFVFLLKHKHAKRYIKTLDVLLSFVMFSDLMFYRYFNDLISVSLLFQAGSLIDVGSSLLELLHFGDLLFISDIILLTLLRSKLIKGKYDPKNIGKMSAVRAFSLCVLGLIMIYVGTAQLVESQPTILQTFYDRVYVAQNIGLINYHAADAFRFMEQNISEDNELDAQKQNEIMEFFKARKKSDNTEIASGVGKNKNIIVIQVEALQQFVINKSVFGREITPNLNKLISESIYFDNYYYQTAGGGTSDAEFTTNVSMYPMKEGSAYIRKSGNYYYSLPQKLKDSGYGTIAMHGYKPGFWNRSVMYKSLGFDDFFSKTSFKEDEILGMGISDKSFLNQAFDKLSKYKQPYFSFIITLSSHFPYDNDKSYYSTFDAGEYKDTLLGNYIETVHYTDEALGMFIEKLRSSGLLDNAVLAVYGDHQAIPKDNISELASFMGKEDLNELEWQQLQKVPMIIHLPGSEEPQVISTAGGGTDFMPTLLNIAGLDTSNVVNMGQDLLNCKDGFVVFRNGSFVTDNTAYISSTNTAYNITTGTVITLDSYEEEKSLAEQYLDYSDAILRFDLIDDIKEYLEIEKP
ncbi:MAG: LTA synthase family protein [Lutisporaceae bacterium]